jgi:hypothetical protein
MTKIKEVNLPKEIADRLLDIASKTELGQEILKTFIITKGIQDKVESIEVEIKLNLND